MVQITVLFFGPLFEIVGRRKERLEVENSTTLMDLLFRMKERYGKEFDRFVFFPDGKINDSVAFAVDGVSIPRSRLGRTKCSAVEEFVILPPISGG
jgi:molybdopterin converting factor small subunit